jgi:hypothetical protein
MGILADFFSAATADARLYALPSSQSDHVLEARIAPAKYKGFTSLELEMLWAILEGGEWNPEVHVLLDESIPGDDESWLYRFPEQFVALLADATPDAIGKANAAWAATEELRCSPDDLAPVVTDLQSIARKSRLTGQPMYLWGAL